LEIIPVINKIDMEGAMIPEVKDQIIELIGCKEEDILLPAGKAELELKKSYMPLLKEYHLLKAIMKPPCKH
jgi:GTP-binding protein LepA